MTTTVILGSGIIGVSTAYYLSKHQPGSTIHLVDSSPELFASASGYAAGFVAKDWFTPALTSLGELSFHEHQKLAEKDNGKENWGYASTVTVSYDSVHSSIRGNGEDWLQDSGLARGTKNDVNQGHIPPWLRSVDGFEAQVMDDGSGTLMVDPTKLCQFLLEKCKESGVQIHYPATALGITRDVRGELASIRIGYTDSSTETEIPVTRVLLSAGGWTSSIFKTLFPDSTISIPVETLAGYSLIVKTSRHRENDPCHAVYTDIGGTTVEVFARPSGMLYLAGINGDGATLPENATGSKSIMEKAPRDKLKKVAERYVAPGEGEELEIVREALCFRPIIPGNNGRTCIIDRIDDEYLGGTKTRSGADGGVFVAAGHGCWGISLSLGTGKVMAEMMQGRETSADVGQLGLKV